MRSEGLNDTDILAAKIDAVFQWADAFSGDGLCPAEIMRLADELPIRWGSTVVRSKDRRSGSAVNFVDAQELVQVKWHDSGEGGRATESLSWLSVWELDKYGVTSSEWNLLRSTIHSRRKHHYEPLVPRSASAPTEARRAALTLHLQRSHRGRWAVLGARQLRVTTTGGWIRRQAQSTGHGSSACVNRTPKCMSRALNQGPG